MPKSLSFLRALTWIGMAALVVALGAPAAGVTSAAGACGAATCLYLPTVSTGCKAVGGSYNQGVVFQRDPDNPPKQASQHPGKNLDLRGYEQRTVGFSTSLIDYGSGGDPNAPQFPTLFTTPRAIVSRYFQIYSWDDFNNQPGSLLSENNGSYPITALGLSTTAGETIRTPLANYDLGAGVAAVVLYADADSVTVHYTRDDSSAYGYTIFIDNLCTDPNLLAKYTALDTGARYVFAPGSGYDLPTLTANQPVGAASGSEIVVAITDAGPFVDPRTCNPGAGFWNSLGSLSTNVACLGRNPGGGILSLP